MKKNIAKQKIKKGIPSIGTWVSSGNPLVCETLATSGIDWINIECEHSSIDLGELVHCFRSCSCNCYKFIRSINWIFNIINF